MKKFKFLPHTADIKFQAFGNSLEEVFENSALALANIISKNKIKPSQKKTIKANGNDIESLLVNFLEEFLFLFETKGFLLSKINKLIITKKTVKSIINKTNDNSINKKTTKTNDNLIFSNNTNNNNIRGKVGSVQYYELICEAVGDVNKEKYEISNHVKAITYNEMFVKKISENGKNKWVCQVVVDV